MPSAGGLNAPPPPTKKKAFNQGAGPACRRDDVRDPGGFPDWFLVGNGGMFFFFLGGGGLGVKGVGFRVYS